MTFTPLHGVFQRWSKDFFTRSQTIVTKVVMTIDDARITPTKKRKRSSPAILLMNCEARTKGIPILGSGQDLSGCRKSIAIEQRDFPIPLAPHRRYRLRLGSSRGRR